LAEVQGLRSRYIACRRKNFDFAIQAVSERPHWREGASETLLPDRPVSPHPNLVTEAGLKALEFQLQQARDAYETAQRIEDVNERRRQAANPLRDIRYFAARVRTAQVIASPASTDTVAFGSTVTFERDDGRLRCAPPILPDIGASHHRRVGLTVRLRHLSTQPANEG
jgi:hypothetical protein